jgi:hypothetical protein
VGRKSWNKEATCQKQHAARAAQEEINVPHKINEADEERGRGEEQARFPALLTVSRLSLKAIPRALWEFSAIPNSRTMKWRSLQICAPP